MKVINYDMARLLEGSYASRQDKAEETRRGQTVATTARSRHGRGNNHKAEA